MLIFKFKNKQIFVSLFLFLGFFFIGNQVQATTLGRIYFSTPASQIAPQSEFIVSLLVDTTIPINAVDLQVLYPTDTLEFLNFNDAQSIIDFWQDGPKILTNGQIQLTGGMLEPFKGDKGLIINLAFRAIHQGEAKISFEKNNLYSADGKGTKTLTTSLPTIFFIIKDAPKISISASPDTTSPLIFLELSKSSAQIDPLIIFNTKDKESGIKSIEMRVKKWWQWSDWQIVENPVRYQKGIWKVELRVLNNNGLESAKTLYITDGILIKLPTLLFIVLMLAIYVLRIYNNKYKVKI